MDTRVITTLLDKYFDGNTTIEEERHLKAYFNSGSIAPEHEMYSDLFSYFTFAQTEKLEHDIEMRINEDVKRSGLRVLRNRIMSIAAILVVLIAAIFIMRTELNQNDKILAETEVESAEDALETTMEALAYLGVRFNKATDPISNLKALDKTNILKY